MPSIWIYAILSVFATSLVSLAGVFTLSLKEDFLKKFLFFLVSLSVGALLGDVFIHIIPELFNNPETEGLPAVAVSIYIFLGFIIFFILEKILKWHHSHTVLDEDCAECDTESKKHIGHLNITSDALHNFIDGVLIGASYLVGIEIGIATTLAVFLHEIPQEIGDFGLLLHAGFSRGKALFLNFLSGLVSLVGVLAALILGSFIVDLTPILLAIAAGSFIYIAGSDLVPELHKTVDSNKTIGQLLGISLGFVIMFLLVFFE